ncbi:hypothetical protein [Pseudobacteroides cellulosolvens]|uniref:Uncharacterized protein n=1 Tax=Pseudobacteroides cellulosolvens ATCC 35603 = DSM 2933 TaxID=398512 RepID=A0A0L6JGY4_9FIRM|nr:hypothetical protein [Pseudobacteroides cellulosolvens]KNY24970.1 hypothetical protein Bccel_0227 [Pseudobacteroides cellulosolvens ATCC 35603 = DSM 2933]
MHDGFEINEFSQNKKNELKVKLHNEITTYLYRSLPIAIILSESRLLPWFNQHYIQICSQINRNGYIMVDYMELGLNFDDILEHSYIGYDAMDHTVNIIDFVREQIEHGYYVIACLDEFYLSEKEFYNKRHFVHESLIYGYDNVNKKFMGIGFNRSHSFSKLNFDYDMFYNAFESGRGCYMETAPYATDQALQLIHIKPSGLKCRFDLSNFLKEIKSLIDSTGNIKRVNYISPPNHEKDQWDNNNAFVLKNRVIYGIDTYDVIIGGLDCILEGKQVMDYRAFHLLFEHSSGISKRLEYIRSNFKKANNIESSCRMYDYEVKKLDSLRLDALKTPYISQPKLEKTIIDMKNSLYSVKENSKVILSEVYEYLLRIL